MVDISNRTLALLLVAAVVVSLGSTVVSLNKLETMSITGFASEEATASLEIEGSIAIEFVNATVNFGSGFTDPVGDPDNVCDLYTNAGGTSNNTGFCRLFTLSPAPFVIKNIGNQQIILNLSSNATAAQFITGGEDVTPNPAFQYKLRNKDGGACTGTLVTTYTEFSGGSNDQPACSSLNFGPGNSELYIDLHLNVTTDAETGARSSIITATAS